MRRLLLAFSFLFLLSNSLAETPVIGGSCPLGTSDVQIGGKHTHFFLKCEQTADGKSGGGVWVVKSRAAAASSSPSASPPKLLRKHSNICEQVVSGREGEACSVSPTCLQPHADLPSSYLQCDETHMVWLRKDCHDGTIFNFENQACVVPKRLHSLSRSSKKAQCSFWLDCADSSAECLAGVCQARVSGSSNSPFQLSFPSNCSMTEECPLGSVCYRGVCWGEENTRKESFSSRLCPQGVESLSRPAFCLADHECGEGYTCQSGLCCPVLSQPVSPPSCLSRNGPSCPVGMTWSLTDGCCQLGVVCVDGSVPEWECHSDSPLCPSSLHSCVALPSLSGRSFCCLSSKGQSSSGLVCTYSSCSPNNPCNIGSCNNGYCCSSGNSIPARKVRARLKKRRAEFVLSRDWPVGPPGYGFPKELSDLDSLLIRASGDGTTCAAGFRSDLPCFDGECPPGLFCDSAISKCCPLLLPLSSARANHSAPPRRFSRTRSSSASSRSSSASSRSSSASSIFSSATSHTSSTPSREGVRKKISSASRRNQQGTPSASLACPECSSILSNGCCLLFFDKGQERTRRSCPSSCPCCFSADDSISFCPNGGVSIGNCGFGGGCSPGYSCFQGSCCPSFASVPYNCPGGGSAVGNCVNGGCASGYTCSNNHCCPTQNPFVCVDGTQAVGACVDGKCGSNYSCSNGLCCSASSATPRCLDGSPAVGACIPSCTGDMCGSVQVTYSCGSGYTCTTGNICCQVSTCPLGGTSIGPAVNGLCPSGYVLQGSQCCSTTGLCPANTTFVGAAVNGLCPVGTLTNGVCCSTTVTCAATLSNGPCNADGTCPTVGYGCDTANQYCCPLVDFNNPSNIIGPAIGGLCPAGYTVVLTPNGPPEGECVSLQSIPGICAEAVQAGPCMNGQCAQAGFTCFIAADVCCPTTTRAMHRMPVHGSSLLSKPISHLAPSRGMATSCPGGTPASSACINGLCGAGLVCINDVCCALSEPSTISKSVCPDGQPAVSGCFADGQCGGGLVCVPGVKLCCPLSSIPATPAPSNSLFRMRPIGARCDSHSECVGNADGLSTCDFGVCRCTPAAYAQGIACTRKKHET